MIVPISTWNDGVGGNSSRERIERSSLDKQSGELRSFAFDNQTFDAGRMEVTDYQ